MGKLGWSWGAPLLLGCHQPGQQVQRSFQRDLSLADGMLSGLRSDEGQRYVQTTAPISPGSSGGGLFDAQGSLVGITTLVLTGKENHNQALNFAIAAEAFWQP